MLKVISLVSYTGPVSVRGATIGLATIDSLVSMASITIAGFRFPGTFVTGGRLLDTIRVYGTAGATFRYSSNVTIGGQTAWLLLRTADSMHVISKMPSAGVATISDVMLGAVRIPSLPSRGPVVVGPETGEPNEPANDSPDAVTMDLTGATSLYPVVIYGAVDGDGHGVGTDAGDYFAFTLAAPRSVTIRLEFAGWGAGGAFDPDLDVSLCNAGCAAWISTAGATKAQPENIALTSLAAGTYNIYVHAWDTGGAARPYRLVVY